jgi:MarR family transcriptional regulator, 2-MHQ and catechol-resistance regulon repressor
MAANEPVVHGAIVQELWVAARYGLELSERELRAAGVDPREYGQLSFVGALQPVTRTVLAQATGLSRTTLRDAVGRLIARGHVEERPNPEDRRSTLLVLTPAGQEVFDRGFPAFLRLLSSLDAALEGELQEHEDAVRRVRLALQELSGTDLVV